MKPGEIYVHNENPQIIEVIVTRRKNKHGIAEVCWSMMCYQQHKKFRVYDGQLGWCSREEFDHNYTMIGRL